MIVDIKLKENNESNMFLRALWANLDKKYGKCAWHFKPYKDGKSNIIYLGEMDIDSGGFYDVYIHYKTRGVVDKIEFNSHHKKEEFLKNVDQELNEIIKETIENFKNTSNTYLKTIISSFNSISRYYSDFFAIKPCCEYGLSSITLKIESYGREDAKFVFDSQIKKILDLLSVLTNQPFFFSFSEKHSNIDKYNNGEIFNNDDEFIDGYPIEDEKLIIPKYGKNIINQVLSNYNVENVKMKKLLNAAMHFHAGRKFDAQINDVYTLHEIERSEDHVQFKAIPRENFINTNMLIPNIQEMATVSYISALEVLSTIVYDSTAERCSKCGQYIYSISSKVKGLLDKYLPEHIAKQIHKYYNSRSKFLHEGKLLTHTYTGTTIPQLDCNHESDCVVPHEILLINLREYVSFCIRGVIKEYFDVQN